MVGTGVPKRSYWVESEPAWGGAEGGPPAKADVVVLGAGIAGLTAGYLLARAGRSVTVLEAARVAEGVSGHTTAKVTAQHNVIYADLIRRFGAEKAELYARAQQGAVEWIAERVEEWAAGCDFRRRDAYVYAETASSAEKLREEADAAASLGLPAEYVTATGLPFAVEGAVRFGGQGQFHPRRWLHALADRLVAAGGTIHEGVRATGLSGTTVRTTAGEIRARDVVVTTHSPAFDRGLYFARLEPRRTLLMAAPLATADEPPGMYISADSGHTIRATPARDGGAMLLVGGESYPPGEDDHVQGRFDALAAWGEETFGVQEFPYQWASQDNTTLDGLPYIGRYHPFADRLWVAAGFGFWGMTNGTVAAHLLTDLITGAETPFADLFDPGRPTIRRSAPALVGLALHTAKHYALDYPAAFHPTEGPDPLSPGEGRITHFGRHPVAVSRDQAGHPYAVSAVCPHQGCLVAYNDAEQTWDCPCHGSRFAHDGSVLHGPATQPLTPVDLDGAAHPEAEAGASL
ncbi:glycine/D-amino acid oxidase-like deaminating enzyme [Actinocorallia herbida]|uniref:Glycine/D-amino acid oxidase-like deaminating enzyme n=1 Tax=Actinocorallia herbida TaxID=58109 RepID=A0A3N1CX53_9ACTN|nr:FAD-dependent oxidoreductase [Actinocorallia herbida]ROO85867.1 glycine/D-amino acid oxidase-like deaminating enzyme [Actinocorallia herbida]